MYKLNQAAERIGVSSITLKRWLLSGKVEDVKRDRNGWRIFSDEDLARISHFAHIVTESAISFKDSKKFEKANRFKLASFFSGIGGLDLGFQQAGFEITVQCEIDTFCRNILDKHWPDVHKLTDIKEVNIAGVPISDVWVGGFPCQDISLARMGKREGLRGKQSGLFYEFARLVGEGRPRVLVIENVAGLLSSHGGRDFKIILQTLAKLGYTIGWRTLNSRYFGVPQSRQRIYIVGCYRDWRGPSSILFEPQRSQGDAEKGRPDGKKSPSPFKEVVGDLSGKGPVIQSIAYCLYACSARHTGTDWSRNYVCYPRKGDIRRLTPKECEGVMSFPEGWTVPTNGKLKVDDIDSARYHALGNAVTPPVAFWLAKRIKSYLQQPSL